MIDNIEVARLISSFVEAVLSEAPYAVWEIYLEILLLLGNITCSGTAYKL